MGTANIVFGALIMIMGVYAIALNKYPGKDASYENAVKRHKSVNERKLALFDGGFCLVFGLAYMVIGTIFLAILLIAYFPLREMLLKFKVI